LSCTTCYCQHCVHFLILMTFHKCFYVHYKLTRTNRTSVGLWNEITSHLVTTIGLLFFLQCCIVQSNLPFNFKELQISLSLSLFPIVELVHNIKSYKFTLQYCVQVSSYFVRKICLGLHFYYALFLLNAG